MARKQANTCEYIAQAIAKAARTVIQTMSATGTERAENAGPRMGGPIMKQPTFNWSAKDKYVKLRSKLEVKNILQNVNTSQMERVSIIRNWLSQQSLQILETTAQGEQEAYNEEGLFKVLNKKFKPQYNETIKTL